jgi:hypothetical protein
MATFVYGFNTVIARRSLWADLHRWFPIGPWMILGDFNSILNSANKYNEEVSNYKISDFRASYSDLGLHDINYMGCHFTWTNGNI